MPDLLWPADDVFITMVETDAIVLTVSADRYDCLLDAGHLFRISETGAILPTDPETADALVASGLIQRTPPSIARKRSSPPRSEASIDQTASVSTVIRSTIQLVSATLMFRRLSFAEMLTARPPSPRPRSWSSAPPLPGLLAGYRAALPWIPFEGECLQRAYLLKRLLERHGVKSDWVFGVRTWPFSAHCWLQIGDRVVGDTVGRVKSYTPIMVV